MNSHLTKVFFLLIFVCSYVAADIQLIKKENSDLNTTLLVIGGIHGNEPGGYFAPSILASHYKITSKNLWIVPNLNKESIRVNERGIHGDMNRKFATISKYDKDGEIVQEIKDIILSKQVSLIINLHDGHGFYRKKNQGNIFNPNAWGQTCVIDQCDLPIDQEFGDLNKIALKVKQNLNKNLLQDHHTFDVRNTNTKFDDESMQLSLTYFAVTHNKPAFAIETSKNIPSLSTKVYYQLLAIEEFMKIMDISFIRDFELTEENINNLVKEYGTLKINDNISLDLNDIKKSLSYIPIKSSNNAFKFSHPLGDFIKVGGKYIITIGNQNITTLKPQRFNIAQNCPEKFNIEVDGKLTLIDKGSDFFVKDSFKVVPDKNCRVNIIGFKSGNSINESGLAVNLKSLSSDFSIDESNKVYRVELYKNDDFCTMLTAHFK